MGLVVCTDCGKQHSIEALLCPNCGRPNPEARDSQRLTFPRQADELMGIVLSNKYQLDELVGKGGMACVYRGTHLQLDQQVAIKVVHRGLSEDPEIQQRFRKEAQIQFKLQHRGLVRVLDLIDEQGILGMAMDWIEGDTLGQWMRKRREPPTADDILRLFAPLLETMAFAHSEGVIHRDIKPGNILLSGAPGQEKPKVTDFGIAKILDDSSHQTQANASLGTPTYMSPEQVEGQPKIDHRADIYSLGILLCCMATGRPPFRGDSPMDVAMSHLNDPVPPLQSLYHYADLRLEPVIMKALSKAPEARYSTCEEFLQALRDALAAPLLADSGAAPTMIEMELPASLAFNKTTPSPSFPAPEGWETPQSKKLQPPSPFGDESFDEGLLKAPDDATEDNSSLVGRETEAATIASPGLREEDDLISTSISAPPLGEIPAVSDPEEYKATIEADLNGPLGEMLQARIEESLAAQKNTSKKAVKSMEVASFGTVIDDKITTPSQTLPEAKGPSSRLLIGLGVLIALLLVGIVGWLLVMP